MRGGSFSDVISPPMPGSTLFSVLLGAELLPHVKPSAAADQCNGRRPVMQTQHHTCHHRGNPSDLSNLSNEIQFGVCHFPSSVALRAILFQSRFGSGISMMIRRGSSPNAAAP